MQSAELYHKYARGKHWEQHSTVYAENFVRFLLRRKFKGLVLDIGCGIGRDVEVFSRAGLSTMGVDYDNSAIRRAKIKYTEGKFEVQNAEQLQLRSGTVGACFMINVIHYVQQSKALDEVFRVLKPRGFFYIHFNLSIVDNTGYTDYKDSVEDIRRRIKVFRIVRERQITRHDTEPIDHTHTILELILQKSEVSV